MRHFGLIGYPLSHSFSAEYFTNKFRKEKIAETMYRPYELSSIELLPLLLSNIPFEGLNVTLPFKEIIIPMLDEIDDTAVATGAVNVIKIKHENGKNILHGYNTDVIGFERSIRPHLSSYHKSALILGTGGASKAAAYILGMYHIPFKFVSREKQGENIMTYADLTQESITDNLIIINATPVGMVPGDTAKPDIPYQFLTDKHLLYDMVYNPPITEFMNEGRKYGADTISGLKMFFLQAEWAWRIWNDGRC